MIDTQNNVKIEPVDIRLSVTFETLVGVAIIVLLFLINRARKG